MVIKILGAGCSSCAQLEKNTKEALKRLGSEAQVIKISDIQDILAYSVMSFPALVIDENVVLYGQNPTVEELMQLIRDRGL
ncbi:MAG TPA: thioredoxin family protein [Candidatus Dependentiae bacterium]|nr:thioredoxin family protein [Candidatus Dependentiae bacterium]